MSFVSDLSTKRRLWEIASSADWSTALEREAVIRPLRIAPAQSGNHCPTCHTHDPGIRFKYMELAPVYDLSAVNQRHFRHSQFLVQRDSRIKNLALLSEQLSVLAKGCLSFHVGPPDSAARQIALKHYHIATKATDQNDRRLSLKVTLISNVGPEIDFSRF